MEPKEMKSTCSYCGVGCGLIVKKDWRNRIQVEGDVDHPVNRGMLCSKGMNLHHVVNDTSDRLLYPEMRWSRSHPRERVTWDEALDRAAGVFRSIIEKHGPDSVGFYISGQCLTEEYYIANKLVKGFIGTNNIDTNSRLCMSSAVVGYKKTFGEDSVPGSYTDIELADTFLIAGANPAWCHPILFRRIEQHKINNPDVRIIVADPRRTDTAAFADLHLQLLPGTDVFLYHAIGRYLLKKGFVDKHFIDHHTEGFLAFKKAVLSMSMKELSELCGVSEADIKKAATIIGKSKRFISLWAMGLNQSTVGTDKNFALMNLSLVTGQVGKPGSGPFSLTGQPNAMGGREVGGMANLLAVHKDLENASHRREVADFWGVDHISYHPGYTATEMVSALEEGKLKAIWIVCTNPIVSLPNSRKVEAAMKKAKFVVVQDISNSSDTVAVADLVLPAAGWLEKEGTMTNSERRISYLPRYIHPPGEARPDVEILCDFAQRMGYHGFNFNNTSEIYDEYAQMTRGTNIDVSQLNYDRLKNEGTFQWPVSQYRDSGTERLFQDKQFYTPSKRARFNIPNLESNPKFLRKDPEYPLVLTTGRVRDQWHTMTKTGKVARLNTHYPDPVLEINTFDAVFYDIKEGDVTQLFSKYGDIRLRAKVTNNVRKGVVFVPIHWGKQLNNDLNRANNVTSGEVDPSSKQPDFKYTLVNIEKYEKVRERIVVVGAGAASFRFVENYREHNTTDEIMVFSSEPNSFYNRVLLPEYITQQLSWGQLQKIKGEALKRLQIEMKPGVSIQSVNREAKYVVDDQGTKHNYDKLILATGSRAFAPRDVQIHRPGRFTLRSKRDADEFKSYMDATRLPHHHRHVVVVGGGLLGLEVAAALREDLTNVTLVQRASRLMERQLDKTASRILQEDVFERGIQVYFDNEVSTVFDDDETQELNITLKSGRTLQAHAIVYATGTRPNIELAKDAGLICGRGVRINRHMQTSDPEIFALGEIAEFEDHLYGITSAAEEQAAILANLIAGDVSSSYKGSVPMNILKFSDLDVCSLGNIHVPPNDDSYEEIILLDISQRYYKKCIVKNDLLVGAILMGNKNEFAEFKDLIERKIELGDKREQLLRGSGGAHPVKGQLVCSCSQVGQGNIEEAIQSGCSNFTDLCAQTGAGLGCGSCKSEVREILRKSKTAV